MVGDDLSVLEAWAKRNQEPVSFNGVAVDGGKKGWRCLQARRKREEYEVVDLSSEGLRDMFRWISGAAMDPRATTQGLGGDQMSLGGHWEQAIRAREVLTWGRPGSLRFNQALLQVLIFLPVVFKFDLNVCVIVCALFCFVAGESMLLLMRFGIGYVSSSVLVGLLL